MPVPTDTFRNMKRLNLLFALAAVVLLVGTFMLVMADYNRPWRQYQRQANLWSVAMTKDAAEAARRAAEAEGLTQLQQQQAELRATLPHDEIAQLRADYRRAENQKKELDLLAAVKKGEIGPLTQEIERLTLEHGPSSPQVQEAIRRRTRIEQEFRDYEATIRQAEARMLELMEAIDAKQAELTAIQKQIDNLQRRIDTEQERLAQLNPTGLARIGKIVRDAPLLDWFNPTEKVQQVVVPGVRTDLNFLTVETIDRCQTCHIHIDQPSFEENNLLLFAERQLAQAQGQEVNAINHPVVLVEFWERAAEAAGLSTQLAKARQTALAAINTARAAAGQEAIDEKGLAAELARIASATGPDVAQRYAPLSYYMLDLRTALRDALGKEGFDQLRGLYRHELVAAYNAVRSGQGLPELSASPVLLGHPRMDLYVEADSAHPMKMVGCTSCHEGAGQETQFEHTAHTPREMWVDAQTGAPVPQALVTYVGDRGRVQEKLRARPQAAERQLAAASDGPATAAAIDAADQPAHHDHAHDDHGHAPIVQHDIKLNDPHGDPYPFAPDDSMHGEAAAYVAPGSNQLAMAVSQEAFWKKAYGWTHVHYMHWEKPMHSLEYVESSCNRCHTEIFDIKDEAPRLFEGRKLFVQQGCAGCHAVTDVLDDADFKLMGPSLVHVKHKLSHEMMASWIWSPKAFRPMTRMPHFFMLENNSAPVDILRTRVETTAMTHYLRHAQPTAEYYRKQGRPVPAYNPEPLPASEDLPERLGDPVARGRVLFNNVGCLGCHTNMAETGEAWIVEDLMKRRDLSREQASAAFRAMDYNAQHWYAMEHLQDKITQVGPELSGVGTKLLAGRDREQAMAWLYDWLRNPTHYSDYTIMPSLRLTEAEAYDLASYLLSLKRPDYEPAPFDLGGTNPDSDERKMLEHLVATLNTAGLPLETEDDKLSFVGQKMIAHYGCNGCHVVPGMEEAAAACTTLDDWGVKDPHKLDFGYFDHAFDKQRQRPWPVPRVVHEGLESDAPHLTARDADKLVTQEVAWEHMHALERRPWLYHKLHNTRIYDRGRTQLGGDIDQLDRMDRPDLAVGRPYDKLKMPKFFLTDEQVQALVTYVTSIRRPLVSEELMVGRKPDRLMLARGRQTAEMYNCYGCHNIEGNHVLVQQYFNIHNSDGTIDYDQLNLAPPRLIGQGSKTQPDWLAYFLNNVHPLRPWLRIRMPSYPLDSAHTHHLNDYFASASLSLAAHLKDVVGPIDAFVRTNPDAPWFEAPQTPGSSLAEPVLRLRQWGQKLDLIRPREIDPRTTSLTDRAAAWNRLLTDVKFLAGLNQIDYPFPVTPRPELDAERFARGEALFNELRCAQCHAIGDEQTLAELHNLSQQGATPVGKPAPPAPAEEEYGYDTEPAAGAQPAPAAADEDDYGYDEPAPAAQVQADDDYGYGDDAPATQAQTAAAQTVELSIDDVLPVRLIGGKLYSAPNLSYSAHRLRWDWFRAWLMEPATIQPGTSMPQWFDDGKSAYEKFGPQMDETFRAKYGWTGDEQMKLLMDYIYAVGVQNYTPGSEKLAGIEKKAVALAPLEKPRAAQEQAAAGQAGEQAESEARPQAAPPPPASKPVEAATSSIELHEGAVAYEGTRVVGVIRFEGRPARRRPVRMDQDAFCRDAHDEPILDESFVVNDRGELKNALVYVKSGLSGPVARPADMPQAVLDQDGCMYKPHVLAMMPGDLLILNSDNTLHNVKMNSSNNGSFNEGMPVKGMQLPKTFSKPELGITFKCDVHPWMGATLHVIDHPYFAVSDIEGRYEIKGLPPGSYTLEVVHERGGRVEVPVTVEAGWSVRVDAAVAGN